MTDAIEFFMPDPNRYSESEFIKRLLKRRLHLQPIECLVASFYRNDELMQVRQMAKGTASTVRVPLVAILRRAQKLGATGISVAHNHPDGLAVPSTADVTGSKIAFETCWRCGIELRDELILSRTGVYSMRDFGPWPKALESYTAIRNKNLIFPD